MNPSIYKEAVSDLAIPKLTEFLKGQTDIVEIEGWVKMLAPEKRENLISALVQSKPLREQFVAFYADASGSNADFSEWELEVAQATPEGAEPPAPADLPPDGGTIAPVPAVIAPQAPTTFVDGVFETIVSEVAGLDANASKLNLIESEDRMEFEHIRIGALLAHIQSSQHYKTLGYDSLREFLTAETGLQYRKAIYLITNYTAVRELGITASDLKGVTWSALRHVIPVMNTKNYKKWLDAARSTVHSTLIEQVAAEKAKQQGALPAPDAGQADAPENKPVTKTFSFHPDQHASVHAAIEKAKTEGNVESNGAALDLIAAAYTGAPPSDATVANVLPDTSPEGLIAIFSKMRQDGGIPALVGILQAVEAIWPEVDMQVDFPEGSIAAE